MEIKEFTVSAMLLVFIRSTPSRVQPPDGVGGRSCQAANSLGLSINGRGAYSR